MIVLSLLNNCKFILLIGSSDQEYNRYFLKNLFEKINHSSSIYKSTTKEFLVAGPNNYPYIIIEDLDITVKNLKSDELQLFFENFKAQITNTSSHSIFFLQPNSALFSNENPIIKGLLNDSIHFIPNPDSYTQRSFFSVAGSKELETYLLQIFKKQSIPIFIIQLVAKSFKKYFPDNMSPASFIEAGGFVGITDLTGKKLEKAILEQGLKPKLNTFFRTFLLIGHNNSWSLKTQTKEEIQEMVNESSEYIDILLRETIKFGFVQESYSNQFKIASESLLNYWTPFKGWIENEIINVNKYRNLQRMALQYHNQKGPLLSEAQIDEFNDWKKSFPFSNAWGEQYALQTELIENYIQYSVLINSANKEAETRKNKRLIRMTRAIATIIGIAFILSFVAAIYAGIERKRALEAQIIAEKERVKAVASKEEAELQRIKAEEASKAESIAKIAAEKDKQAALLASEAAIIEKQKALEAKSIAEQEREKAEIAKIDAEEARFAAELAKEKAILAQNAEKEALEIATNNFENAEKLRLQQTASNMGLTASQLLRELKIEESLRKAIEAFQLNFNNDGTVFETAIAKALIEAHNKYENKGIIASKPIKKIEMSANGKFLACLFIDDELVAINLDSKATRLITNDVSYVTSGENNDIWICTKYQKIFSYNFESEIFTESPFSNPSLNTIGIIPPSSINTNELIIAKNGIYNYPGQLLHSFPLSSNKTFFAELDTDQIALFLQRELSSEIYSIFPSGKIEKRGTLKLPNQEKISTLEFLNEDKVLYGNQKGNIAIYNMNTQEKQELGNIHDSRISFLKVVDVLDTKLVISASYDHSWKITPVDLINNKLGQSISFNGHSGWITAVCYDKKNNILFTAGNDKNILTWQINLIEIVNEFGKI